MGRQPTVVLNAALPKTIDTGSGINLFRRIGGLAMAPDLMQCQAFRQRHRLSRAKDRCSTRSAAEGVERMGEGEAFSLLGRVSCQSVGPLAGRRGLSVGGVH